MSLKLLELFKGTGSVGKQAVKMGFKVTSLDLDPIYTPDIETDILKWDYKKWATENKYVPDMIWASPPCNTFSPMVYRLKERDPATAEPFSDRAKLGTKILYKTLEIIKYFQGKNPKLLFIFENPRGMMRNDPKVKKFARETTLYCLYGDFKKKPTDFWNNLPDGLKLSQEKQCPGETIPVQLTPGIKNLNLDQRYSMPSKLIKAMLQEFKLQYGQKTGGSVETDAFETEGIVSLPEFASVKVDMPTYMVKRMPDIKGKPPPYRYKLVIPITQERNLSSRKNETSIVVSQKPISEVAVREPNVVRPKLEEFNPTDRMRIQAYYENVKANERNDLEDIAEDAFDVVTRGLPCFLYKNCEKGGYDYGENERKEKPAKKPKTPKPPKQKKGRPKKVVAIAEPEDLFAGLEDYSLGSYPFAAKKGTPSVTSDLTTTSKGSKKSKASTASSSVISAPKPRTFIRRQFELPTKKDGTGILTRKFITLE